MSEDRHTGHPVPVRLPEELYQQLAAAAKDHDVAVNWLVVKAIKMFLADLLPAEEVRWHRGD